MTRRIRTNDAVREMPVILLTGELEGEDMVAGYEAGADDTCEAVQRTEELISSVHSALDRG